MFKKYFTAASFFCCMLIGASFANAQCDAAVTAMNLTYSQNFDTLANTGTSSSVPAGILFSESGTNANTTYTAGTGSSNAGDTYSFGASASTERAFGGLQSGSLVPTVGGCITNNTGGTVTQFTLTFDGEQWRLGAISHVDRLDFQYSTNATSLTTGTWIDVDALDFTAPVTGPTVGALDGNSSANRTSGITSTVSGLSIPNGSSLYFRFVDFDATGSDDGLAIDNLTLTVAGTVAASGTISGQVKGQKGQGLRFCTVMLTGGSLPEPLYATTNMFGQYRFEDVPLGEGYILQVFSRRYSFAEPSRYINLNDSISHADFIGDEQ